MVDYLRYMPEDILHTIYKAYFSNHVLPDMKNIYFKHISGVKNSKDYELYIKECVNAYIKEKDVLFTQEIIILSELLNKCFTGALYTKILSIREVFDRIISTPARIGMIHYMRKSGIDQFRLFSDVIYNKLHDENILSYIGPKYTVILYNEIPKINKSIYRGCY